MTIRFPGENTCGATKGVLTYDPHQMRMEVRQPWHRQLLGAATGIALAPLFLLAMLFGGEGLAVWGYGSPI
jgi:hypothetical protein